MKTVVFTGGGTGGHIYPGLAVVDELKEKINSTKIDGTSLDVKIVWIGSSKGMDKNLVEKSGSVDKFIGIPCGKLRRYFSFQNFIDLFKIAAGFISAFFHLAKLKPLVVFSKGGFVSVPSCYAAKLLKIPVFTHECDFSTGLATRLNLKVAEKLLKPYNFNVTTALSGKECIYKIKEGNVYDIIFLDHMMPEMDGIEVVHILKKLSKNFDIPPIVALTANAVTGMREMYLNEGFDEYVSKPINVNELNKVINKFFRRDNNE